MVDAHAPACHFVGADSVRGAGVCLFQARKRIFYSHATNTRKQSPRAAVLWPTRDVGRHRAPSARGSLTIKDTQRRDIHCTHGAKHGRGAGAGVRTVRARPSAPRAAARHVAAARTAPPLARCGPPWRRLRRSRRRSRRSRRRRCCRARWSPSRPLRVLGGYLTCGYLPRTGGGQPRRVQPSAAAGRSDPPPQRLPS